LIEVSTTQVPFDVSHKCLPPVDAPPASRKVISGTGGVLGLAELLGDCEWLGLMDGLTEADGLSEGELPVSDLPIWKALGWKPCTWKAVVGILSTETMRRWATVVTSVSERSPTYIRN
jgi:hypothetical protein